MCRSDATMTSLATFQSDCLVVRMNQNNGGSGVSGQSIATLNYSTSDNDGYMWRMIRVAEVPDQEDVAAAGADVIVLMNNRANQYLRDV